MSWFWIFVVVWLGCGILNYGWALAHYQGMYPLIAKEQYQSDRAFAALMLLMGVIGTIVVLLIRGWDHGLQYRRR